MSDPIIVTQELAGLRCDLAFAQCFPELSRNRIRKLIDAQQAWIDQQSCTPKTKVMRGQVLSIDPEALKPSTILHDEPEPIDLNIIYEDEDLLVINKPIGLVVHPGAGQSSGTLLNALLHHKAEQSQLARAGIVHRLDKMTSGLMVVAKTEHSQTSLINQLKTHSVQRIYYALVRGEPISGGTIDADIGRHPKDRKKMSVRVKGGKRAVTHYRILQRFRGYTLLEVRLETGRTHQIRVHLAHKGYPIVGDPIYAGRQALPAKLDEQTREAVLALPHQALHAYKLKCQHPTKNRPIQWKASLPDYFKTLLDYMTPHPSQLWEQKTALEDEPECFWAMSDDEWDEADEMIDES